VSFGLTAELTYAIVPLGNASYNVGEAVGTVAVAVERGVAAADESAVPVCAVRTPIRVIARRAHHSPG
jgi:hypothetical protein